MIHTETLHEGPRFTILVAVKDGNCPVRDFLQNDLSESERRKMLFLINQISGQGVPCNPQKFNNEGNDIYALKTHTARIYCFFHGQRRLVLTHGFKKGAKGGKKAQTRERDFAKQIRNALQNAL